VEEFGPAPSEPESRGPFCCCLSIQLFVSRSHPSALVSTHLRSCPAAPRLTMLFCPYCSNNLTIGDSENSSENAWWVQFGMSALRHHLVLIR
jgi:hypothetical protein